MKIAIINTSFLKEQIQDYVTSLAGEHSVETFIYKGVQDIKTIIPKIAEDYDAFFVNGSITEAVIYKMFPDFEKPVVCFNGDSIEYYHSLLDLNLNYHVNFNRILIDFIPDEWQSNLGALIENFKFFDFAYDYMEGIDQKNIDELIAMKGNMLEKIKRLWQTGKFDMVVTRFSTIMEDLEQLDIKARFIYPSKRYIQMLLGQLIDKSNYYYMRKNLHAVIIITLKQDQSVSIATRELAEVSLKKELLQFQQDNSCNFVLQQIDKGYQIITDEKQLSDITDGYSSCHLKKYLETKINYTVNIGYGTGESFSQASLNAVSANRESRVSQGNFSYFKNAFLELIGPLNDNNAIVIPTVPDPKLSKIAAEVGLSPVTLQRIISVTKLLGTNIITAKDISEKLGVTVRSANRFLSALEKSHRAEVHSLDLSTSRGRPGKVYKILLEEQ